MKVTVDAIRLHTSSGGVDATALATGRDVVLHLHPVHGTDAPHGTYVLDHLAPADRHAADRAALDAQAVWRQRFDAPLTVRGVCWPFVWELDLYEALNPAVARALGLRRALERLDAGAIELADSCEDTALLARAVGDHLGIPVRRARASRPPGELAPGPPSAPRARRVRQAALGALTGLGAPTVLRRGSVAVHPYWPLIPLLDRMLDEPGLRPALFLESRPTGVARALRTAMRGGWIGLPTSADRRRARADAAPMVDAVRAGARIALAGVQLGAWLQPRLARVVARRAATDLAEAAMLRRAFRSRRLRSIVGSFDIDPRTRLVVLLAREAGIRTLMLSHGAYLLPQPVVDLDVCDEVALWAPAVAPPITNRDRPIHLVGYPLPHESRPAILRDGSGPARIAVLGQLAVSATSVLDERITMRCYETALRAIARVRPDAIVTLRPHPTQERATHAALVRRFPELRLEEDAQRGILDVLRGVDLCIGGASTSTLQAALVGTPAIALNLSGDEWPYPIGGETSVPVARSAADLDALLDRWTREGTLPGREDLLAALGADGSDAVARLLAIVAGDGAQEPVLDERVGERPQLPQRPAGPIGDRQQVR